MPLNIASLVNIFLTKLKYNNKYHSSFEEFIKNNPSIVNEEYKKPSYYNEMPLTIVHY